MKGKGWRRLQGTVAGRSHRFVPRPTCDLWSRSGTGSPGSGEGLSSIAIVQLEGHVLQPLLLGRAVALHPLAVVLSIAAGVVVAGIAGALFAVPLLAILNSGIRSLLSSADEHVDPDDVHTSSPEETGPDQPGLDRQPDLDQKLQINR